MYPTLTTANASAIATGHYLGDTGDYANVLHAGFPLVAKQGSTVPFLEDDGVLQELKAHFGDGYMGPEPLLCAAHAHGFTTAVVGKVGPAAIQAIDCLAGTPVVDDFFGRPSYPDGSPTGSLPLPADLIAAIRTATGSEVPPVSAVPNVAQQKWFVAAVQKALLPSFKTTASRLYWSSGRAIPMERSTPSRIVSARSHPASTVPLQKRELQMPMQVSRHCSIR